MYCKLSREWTWRNSKMKRKLWKKAKINVVFAVSTPLQSPCAHLALFFVQFTPLDFIFEFTFSRFSTIFSGIVQDSQFFLIPGKFTHYRFWSFINFLWTVFLKKKIGELFKMFKIKTRFSCFSWIFDQIWFFFSSVCASQLCVCARSAKKWSKDVWSGDSEENRGQKEEGRAEKDRSASFGEGNWDLEILIK